MRLNIVHHIIIFQSDRKGSGKLQVALAAPPAQLLSQLNYLMRNRYTANNKVFKLKIINKVH